MTSVASELNVLSHLHPQTSRNPSASGQGAETPFAALLDIDVQQEPVSKKTQVPAEKPKAHKPEAPSGQRPAANAKDPHKPGTDKSTTTDTTKSEETGSEDEVQNTATEPAKEEEEVKAADGTTDPFLIAETEAQTETEAQPEQPVVATQPPAAALPVVAEVTVTPAEGETDLLAQAPAQPAPVPAVEPEAAPVIDAPELALDPSLAAEGREADVKSPETKAAAAETNGQGAAEDVPQIEGKSQQLADNGEHGKDSEAKDGKEAKVDATPRPHDEVKPEAPRAQDSAPAAKPAADAPQLSLTPAQIHASATGQAHTASATPLERAVPVSGLAVEIAAQARAGKNRFEIRLDPPELGRIDVRIDVDREGNVTSRLMIERADTYDLLRRDASTLERALQNAGLKTSDNALEFSLRDHGFAQRDEHGDRPNRGAQVIIPDGDEHSATVNPYGRALGLGGGLDIRV